MQLYKVKTNEKGVDVDKEGFLRSFGVTRQYARGEALKKARMFNGKIVKGIISEQGRCPKCQKQNLDYGAQDLQDDSIIYPYECRDCGFLGKEWFELSFQFHSGNDGQDV
jgi:hypothetical protein